MTKENLPKIIKKLFSPFVGNVISYYRMIKNIIKKNSGYSLLETIFYVSFFVIISILVINSMIIMTKAFRETTIQAELMQGSNIMERISREIRQANGINSISTNNLKLDTTDDLGANKTVEFSFSSPNIRILDNDVFTGNLNTQNITVLDITFARIDTVKSSAVKVFLKVKSNNDLFNREEDFYDTVVLRGKY